MKTAVEWFEQKLDDFDIEIPFGVFDEAKEIFKEQIKDAYFTGNIKGQIDANILSLNITKVSDAENYYNETFKNQ